MTTPRQAAETIWGIARDLASPRYSGTPLNSERAVGQLEEVITTAAKAIAADMTLADEAKNAATLAMENRKLKAELKDLKKAK